MPTLGVLESRSTHYVSLIYCLCGACWMGTWLHGMCLTSPPHPPKQKKRTKFCFSIIYFWLDTGFFSVDLIDFSKCLFHEITSRKMTIPSMVIIFLLESARS